MDEYCIEYRNVSERMLKPELIVAESGRAGICNNGRSYECENCTCKYPEINNFKKILRFRGYHIASEYNCPAANCNGQMVNRVWIQFRYTYKTSKVGHLANYHSECQSHSEFSLMPPTEKLITVYVNEIN